MNLESEVFEVVFNGMKVIRGILKRKNEQIRSEREKLESERVANAILSAYVALLVSRHGAVRIPKKEVSEALGKYFARASSHGDDYVIEVGEMPASVRKRSLDFGKTGKI